MKYKQYITIRQYSTKGAPPPGVRLELLLDQPIYPEQLKCKIYNALDYAQQEQWDTPPLSIARALEKVLPGCEVIVMVPERQTVRMDMSNPYPAVEVQTSI